MTNWQLAQARTALEVYYEQFRGIPRLPREDAEQTRREPDKSEAAARAAVSPTPSVRPSSSVASSNASSFSDTPQRYVSEETPVKPLASEETLNRSSGKALPAGPSALPSRYREQMRYATGSTNMGWHGSTRMT
jgi:hypothetical protein